MDSRYFLVLIVFLLGCSKEKNDCMKSTGDIVFEERTVTSFNTIELHNNVNVIITQGTENTLKVEAGSNLLSKITTDVVNDTLVIFNENKCNWIRSYKYDINVHVTVQDLRRVNHLGYGTISTTNAITATNFYISNRNNGDLQMKLNVGYMYTDMHLTGDVLLTGTAGGHEVYSSGNNWLRCEGLVTGYTALHSATTGDCYVNATDSLVAKIFSLGSIYYSGNPQKVTSELVGEGELIKN